MGKHVVLDPLHCRGMAVRDWVLQQLLAEEEEHAGSIARSMSILIEKLHDKDVLTDRDCCEICGGRTQFFTTR